MNVISYEITVEKRVDAIAYSGEYNYLQISFMKVDRNRVDLGF
jgi:hypothetical protein